MDKPTYYYSVNSGKSKQVTAKVYFVKNDKLEFLGETKWQRGSFKGEVHEVYDFIRKNDTTIAKEPYDGYYSSSNSSINIQEME